MRNSILPLIGGMMLALSACGEAANPLIGDWEIRVDDPGAKAMLEMLPEGMRMMSFAAEKVTVAGQDVAVRYEILDAHAVIVKADGQPDSRIEVETVDGTECLKLPQPRAQLAGVRYCRKA
ncbi:MAG: hypothetical protein HXY22_09605 [Alphaproteobacteria bacterium]|nr:hypothetical protein [Alphaproteobacteria bacterium]